MGSIPVRIHPMFWVIGALFGFMGSNSPVATALWILAMFVSILVHEMGHALAAKYCGWPPRITLHGMGGLAHYIPTHQRRVPRALIAFAGPGAGFLKGGIILAIILATGHGVTLPGLGLRIGGPVDLFAGRLGLFVHYMLFMDILWGLLNLAPIQPLDGGHIAGTIIEKYRPRQALALSLKLSIGTAAVFAVIGVTLMSSFYIAILFGMLGFQSWQMLEQAKRQGFA